jgi:glycosyltransferase involved in cell wall biosynthesis
METASLGVVPKRKDGFGNEAFSTKVMEFMAMGVPVVVPDTDIDRYYYDDSIVRFFRAGDAEDLARAMLDLIESPQKREALVDNASRFIEENDWNAKQHEYLELVERLTVNSEA